jgi:hypothetical protein
MTALTELLSQRPKQVTYAARILWPVLCLWAIPLIGYSIFSLCLPLFLSLEELASYTGNVPGYTATQLLLFSGIVSLVFSSLFVYLNFWLINKMKAGSSGSRYGLILFLIPKIALSLAFIYYYFSHGGLLSLIIPFFTLLEMIALALLYINSAAAWFKRMRAYNKEIMHLINIQMPPQPKQIRVSIWVFTAALLLSFVYYMYTRHEVMETVLQQYESTNLPSIFPELMTTLAVLSYLLMAWLIYKVANGRNWARMITLTLICVGLLAIIPQLVFSQGNTTTSLIVNKYYNPYTLKGMAVYLLHIINIVAVCLLFLKPSNTWYRKRKELENQLSSSDI